MMYVNFILLIVLIISVILAMRFGKSRMRIVNDTVTKRRKVLSLIVNCNNYKPIGDVFSSLSKMLESVNEKDHIEYRGHF